MGRVRRLYFAYGLMWFPTYFVDKNVCNGTFMPLSL